MGRAAAVALLVCALGARARAECGPRDRLPWLGTGQADFGQAPEPCTATDVQLRVGGGLLVDRPDFFGSVTAGATLRGRLVLAQRWLVTGALDAMTFRYVANAVTESSATAVGPPTVGGAYLVPTAEATVLPYVRIMLPLDGGRRYGARWGGELGVSLARPLPKGLALQGGLAVPATLAIVEGTGHGAIGPSGVVELAWGPRPWVALGLGGTASLELAPRPDLLTAGVRPSGRLSFRRAFHLGAAVDVPLAGTDRTDVVIGVFAAWARPEPQR